MPNFNIKYSAFEPVWGEIEILPANNAQEAEDFARDEISMSNPDYSDIEIVEVKEIKDGH